MTINESGVYFFPGGGHNHDGQNSTLIDTNAYSVFDFGWGSFVGTPSRVAKQILNRDSFLQLVSSVVQDTLYETIRFQPGSIGGSSIIAGTITANEIAANTITANLLAANVVLVNQTISSNNYVAGVSGWKISGDGTAEFDAAVIRGTLTAAAVSTPGVDIYSNGMLSANNFTIFANGAIQNNNFSVSASGTLTATNANISGTIIATSVSTPGVDIYANGMLSANNFTIFANGAIQNNNFLVDASGNLNATSGFIGNWEIENPYLVSSFSGGTGGGAWNNQIYLGPLASEGNFHGMEIFDTVSNRFVKLGVQPTTGVLEVGISGGGGFFVDANPEGTTSVSINNGWLNVDSLYLKGGFVSTGYYPFPFANASYMTDNVIYSAGDIESADMITAGGTGVSYNASNLSGTRWGMAFAWDSPIAAVSFIVNNDANVDGWILPDGFYSDRRLKDNISPLTSQLLEKIYSIKIYEFDYKDIMPNESMRGKHDIGVIADELEFIFPEIVVNKDDPEKYRQVLYVKTIPLLLGAMGDLNSRLKAIEQHLGYNS